MQLAAAMLTNQVTKCLLDKVESLESVNQVEKSEVQQGNTSLPVGGTPQNAVDVAAADHPKNLYDYDELVTGIKGWGGVFAGETLSLRKEHLTRFNEDGLLVVEDAFSQEEVSPDIVL